MTDEEILKAFECCCGDDVNGTHCKDCPAEKYNFDWCSDEVSRKMVAYTKRLQAENASLRKRLENALVLPAKVGDTIFEVGGQYTKNIVPWKIREIILHSNGVRFICDCEDGGDLHRCVDVYNNEMQTFWDKSPFCLTSASAEKKLAERRKNQ